MITQNYSVVLTTTPTLIVPDQTNGNPRDYMHIANVNASGGSSAWISYLVNNPAANTAGSLEIPPGTQNGQEFNSGLGPNSRTAFVPQGAIWGVAASGTVQLTVMVG